MQYDTRQLMSVQAFALIPCPQVPFSTLASALKWPGELRKMQDNFVDFWQSRHHPDILLLFFDDLRDDLGLPGREARRVPRNPGRL